MPVSPIPSEPSNKADALLKLLSKKHGIEKFEVLPSMTGLHRDIYLEKAGFFSVYRFSPPEWALWQEGEEIHPLLVRGWTQFKKNTQYPNDWKGAKSGPMPAPFPNIPERLLALKKLGYYFTTTHKKVPPKSKYDAMVDVVELSLETETGDHCVYTFSGKDWEEWTAGKKMSLHAPSWYTKSNTPIYDALTQPISTTTGNVAPPFPGPKAEEKGPFLAVNGEVIGKIKSWGPQTSKPVQPIYELGSFKPTPISPPLDEYGESLLKGLGVPPEFLGYGVPIAKIIEGPPLKSIQSEEDAQFKKAVDKAVTLATEKLYPVSAVSVGLSSGLSAEESNKSFFEKIASSGPAEVAKAGAMFIKDKLQESGFAQKVLGVKPPQSDEDLQKQLVSWSSMEQVGLGFGNTSSVQKLELGDTVSEKPKTKKEQKAEAPAVAKAEFVLKAATRSMSNYGFDPHDPEIEKVLNTLQQLLETQGARKEAEQEKMKNVTPGRFVKLDEN